MPQFLVGLFTGLCASVPLAFAILMILIDRWWVGFLNRDESVSDDPYYFMEVARGQADKLKRNRHVLLEVRTKNYLDPK